MLEVVRQHGLERDARVLFVVVARVHVFHDVPLAVVVLLHNLVRFQRQREARVVQERQLVLLRRLVPDSAPVVLMGKQETLEEGRRELLLQSVRVPVRNLLRFPVSLALVVQLARLSSMPDHADVDLAVLVTDGWGKRRVGVLSDLEGMLVVAKLEAALAVADIGRVQRGCGCRGRRDQSSHSRDHAGAHFVHKEWEREWAPLALAAGQAGVQEASASYGGYFWARRGRTRCACVCGCEVATPMLMRLAPESTPYLATFFVSASRPTQACERFASAPLPLRSPLLPR